MIVFINGSFGIGKTTVARLLVQRLPHSVLFNPEPIGVVMSRLVGIWRPVNDFQDLRSWRAISIWLIRFIGRLRGSVVVPMAFSNQTYLRQFLDKAGQADDKTYHFCLVAPLLVVQERLRSREIRGGPTEWQIRRSAECCEAHQRPEFAVKVATEDRSPYEVAQEMLDRIAATR